MVWRLLGMLAWLCLRNLESRARLSNGIAFDTLLQHVSMIVELKVVLGTSGHDRGQTGSGVSYRW